MRFLILILFLFIACGKNDEVTSGYELPRGSCELPSEFTGQWHHTNRNDTLEITKYCIFKSSYCSSAGSIIPLENNKGVYLLTVVSSDSSLDECTPVGIYNCGIKIENGYLQTNCNTLGLLTYQR